MFFIKTEFEFDSQYYPFQHYKVFSLPFNPRNEEQRSQQAAFSIRLWFLGGAPTSKPDFFFLSIRVSQLSR